MIEAAFINAQGKKVLFLGRLKNFTEDEVKIFLKQYELEFSDTLDEDVAVVIESTMMSPPEEEVSYDVYKQKIPTFRLDVFEKLYAEKITPNSLLMALKLSNDQERLIRLLKNEAFEKSLYLKLFKLYDWKGEGVHDSDENRDVTTTFVKRFYNPDSFMDPAMIYSAITLTSIIADSEDAEVLDAILTMPEYEIKVSRSEVKKPKTLKELVALNPHASAETLKQLSNFKDQTIDYFLVQNDMLAKELQEKIYARASEDIMIMLAQNENLSEELFEKLLAHSGDIAQNLLVYQKMSKERYEKAKNSPEAEVIGENEEIAEILEELLKSDNVMLQRRLASNTTVGSESLEKIYAGFGEKVIADLCSNPNLSTIMIEEFVKLGKYDETLAANPSTPTEILIGYFNQEDKALNLALASNEALPLAYLQQLQLDTTLMNTLANNKTFTKNILNNLGI